MSAFNVGGELKAHDVDACSCWWCGHARGVRDAARELLAPLPPRRHPVGRKFPGVL